MTNIEVLNKMGAKITLTAVLCGIFRQTLIHAFSFELLPVSINIEFFVPMSVTKAHFLVLFQV